MQTSIATWERLKAVNAANPDLLFTVAAIALAIVSVISLPDPVGGSVYKQPDALATTLVIVHAGAVAFARRWPLAVLTTMLTALITHIALGYQIPDTAFFGGLIVVFTLAATTDGVRRIAGLLVIDIGVILIYAVDTRGNPEALNMVLNIGIFTLTWVGGMIARSRMDAIERTRREMEELSLQRDIAVEQAASDERARIARELHDAVGHTLNLIVVQAGAAQRVRDTKPEAAYDALRSIENTGRQALSDMDRMLGVLREQADASDVDGHGPRPGLARLGAMLEEARAVGLPIAVEIEGQQRKLPVSVDLTAYRIVQEAITNVIKHAPGAETTVKLSYAPRAVKLSIVNGPSKSRTRRRKGGGMGLIGMRERVSLFGGTLEASPAQDGGFVVEVSLPVEGGD